MARGDVLFFKGGAPLWTMDGVFEQAIRLRTGGPFVHVEVDLGDGTSVGALTTGVARHPRPQFQASAGTGGVCPVPRREAGIEWLLAKVGTAYGWDDIAAAAIGRQLPDCAGMSARYDCSHLACMFLVLAGYPSLPHALQSAPSYVSPNDLARALRILK